VLNLPPNVKGTGRERVCGGRAEGLPLTKRGVVEKRFLVRISEGWIQWKNRLSSKGRAVIFGMKQIRRRSES